MCNMKFCGRLLTSLVRLQAGSDDIRLYIYMIYFLEKKFLLCFLLPSSLMGGAYACNFAFCSLCQSFWVFGYGTNMFWCKQMFLFNRFQSITIIYIYIYYCNHKPANKASDYVKTITCMDVIWLIGLGARKIQNFEGGRALPTETRISNAVMDDMKCDEMYL